MKNSLSPLRARLALIVTFTLTFAFAGCSNGSGGMNTSEQAKDLDAALAKQDNMTQGLERLTKELTQVPEKEQLTAEPTRDAYGYYILERENNGQYKFHVPPASDSTTGAYKPANTYRVALVDYRRVAAGPYKRVDKDVTLPGFRLDADVTLIDHTIPAVVLRKTFKGEKPGAAEMESNIALAKDTDTEVLGKKPIDQIQKFLDGLPRKN